MEKNESVGMEQSTSQRVKRSMLSMLIGRPISALGGFLVLVLLSRLLSKEEYGAYFALWALVEISILLSDPGVLHLIYRFVSASSNLQGQVMPKGPAVKLLSIRCIALLLGGVILMLAPNEWLLRIFNLAGSPQLLKAAGIILFFEGAARAIEAVFDTMLCQGASQTTTVTRTLIRLGGICACFIYSDKLTFDMLIVVDIVATAFGAALGLALLLRIYIKRKYYQTQFAPEVVVPPKTLFYYAWPAYLSQTLGIAFSADVLKLTLTGANGVTELAVFGYVFSIAAVIQRYLPANLFGGVFRPLFVAAATKENADKLLVELLIACIKINWIVILPVVCISFILGDVLLAKISGGNYQEAGSILTISVFGLLGFSTHLILSHLCLAKKSPWPMLGANLCATIGIFVGMYLGAKYGAIGTAIAFAVNEALWCTASFCFLFHSSPFLRFADLAGVARLLAVAGVTVIIAAILKYFIGLHPIAIALTLALPLVVSLCRCGVFSMQEGQWLMAVLPLGHKLPMVLKFRNSLYYE